MDNKIFAIIGGDFRTAFTAGGLALSGYRVRTCGISGEAADEKITVCQNPAEALAGAEYVILPLPVSADNECITTAFDESKIYIRDIVENIEPGALVLGGKIDKLTAARLELAGISYVDYFEREEFAVLNAVPTAEGAVELAMHETADTLSSSKCLVTGFGRIARALAAKLHGMGADVTIAARRCGDLAWAEVYGYGHTAIAGLDGCAGAFDIIFNTVPKRIFNAELLRHVRGDALIIDLASKPGGVDFQAAGELGINTIWALSLPGKVAPKTAGLIIQKTVLNIIREKEGEKNA